MNGDDKLAPSAELPRVELFGAPRIVVAGQAEPLRLGKKPFALLAYLIVHSGEAQSREKLAELLWPDRFEEQARQSLRQALTALRKALGAGGEAMIVATDGLVSVDEAQLSADVLDFERRSHGSRLEDWIAAAALYRGDFLAQLGSVSETFDAWAAQERERRRSQAVSVVERIITALRADGRNADALAYAQRLVAIDPAHEPGHRTLMTLYAAAGQRAAALRQFEDCKNALALHLDAEPDAATVELHRSIRESAPSAPAPSPVPAAPAAAPAAPALPPLSGPRRYALRSTRLVRLARQRRLILGAALAAALAAIAWLPEAQRSRPAAVAGAAQDACLGAQAASDVEPALIILPLRTYGEDEDLARFAAAATDRIQTVSSLVPGVVIVAGPPPGHPDLGLSPTEIAQRTSATHVLDGSVRRRGERVQATVRLIDGRTGRQLWQSSTRHDAPQGAPEQDPLSAQDSVALIAARGVQEQLTDGRQALTYPLFEPSSVEVWEHNTRGYGLLNRASPVAAEQARAEFNASLALEPGEPGANVGLAFSHLSPILFGWPTDEQADIAAARRYAEAALAANPDHAVAVSAMSIVALLEGDHAAAVAQGEAALRLSGGGGDAAAFLAYVLSYTDDTARAADLGRRALRSRPYAHPIWYEWTLARALRLNGDPAAADCLAGVDLGDAAGAAPAAELLLARAAAGDEGGVQPLVALIEEQASGFSSARYCRLPPPQSAPVAEACIAALTAAGLPE